MESYILPNFPREFSSIHLCLFQNVTNSASLRARLVEAATMEGEQGDRARDEMDYGFVEASMALQAASTGNLKTRTVHSEVLLALHPSNNIADAIKRFGISATTKTLLLVRIGSPIGSDDSSAESSQESVDAYQQTLVDKMAELVEGDMVPLHELPETSDWKAIKKLYKLHEISLPGTSDADDKRILEANMLNTLSTKVVA
ncbi:hypothetical protein QFC21_004703 [Naganishia friedmannii]|uniref:Uncharacterized protein n=1 Tax=Naganishia friedmannii TaxID=89922 RepID=A0ACC2VFP7_9TREE|nr:hypothetical protein QFC21_004703 [Naganishia friedmannii]